MTELRHQLLNVLLCWCLEGGSRRWRRWSLGTRCPPLAGLQSDEHPHLLKLRIEVVHSFLQLQLQANKFCFCLGQLLVLLLSLSLLPLLLLVASHSLHPLLLIQRPPIFLHLHDDARRSDDRLHLPDPRRHV